MKSALFLLQLLLVSILGPAVPTKLTGRVKDPGGDGRVNFLTKFGVKKGHEVFFFGNTTHISYRYPDFHSQVTLVFIPHSAWGRFFRESEKRHVTCNKLINDTLRDSILTTGSCIGGRHDYLRQLPCNGGFTCGNQPSKVTPVAKTQFTYRLTSPPKTEYYYVIIVACTNNETSQPSCNWADTSDVMFTYDMHLVNQDPDLVKTPNPFLYQFPYDMQSLLLIFLAFASCYYTLLVFHSLMNTRLCVDKTYRMHRLVKLFTLSLFFELVHVSLVMIHLSVYASDGVGVEALKFLGEVANLLSDWILILVFVLIAKGWQLTTSTIRWKKVTFFIWGFYVAFSGAYFAWLVVIHQVYPYMTYTANPYQSWAGGLYLAYRLLLLIYILFEMRQIYLIENRQLKLIMYRLLAIFFIVWFCYLPLVVFVSVWINALERSKVITTTFLCFDLMANIIMVVLFCPKWSDMYFQFSSQINEFSRITIRLQDKSLGAYGSSTSLGSVVFDRKE